MLRFVLLATVMALLALGGVYGCNYLEWTHLPSATWEIVICMFIVHVGLYHFVTRQIERRPGDFVKIYLGITVLRILFFGAFIFAIILLDSSGAHENVVLFLVCYFLFTTLEVSALFSKINHEKPAKLDQKGG